MSNGETLLVAVHKWQDQGVGIAPFRLVGFFSMPSMSLAETNPSGYQNAMYAAHMEAKSHGINSIGSCDVCGTGIHNHYVIRDAAGKKFVVGCDCVEKTNDTKLITAVKNEERLRSKAKRDAARQQKRDEERANRIALEEKERSENGGFTLAEIAAKNREKDRLAEMEKHRTENAWLLEVLRGQSGDFVHSMIQELQQRSIQSLSPRCVSILKDIYGKSFGRGGSKAYHAAVYDFSEKIGEIDD